MVTVTRDKKAPDMWIITRRDREGFHRQLAIDLDEMRQLLLLLTKEYEQARSNLIGSED